MDQASMTSAYIWAIVIAVVFFAAATIFSNMVLYKPNNPGTTKKRIIFWCFCIATPVVGFLINFIIGNKITVPNIQSKYLTNAGIAAGICFVAFFVIGFIVSKIFSKSKIGTWF